MARATAHLRRGKTTWYDVVRRFGDNKGFTVNIPAEPGESTRGIEDKFIKFPGRERERERGKSGRHK